MLLTIVSVAQHGHARGSDEGILLDDEIENFLKEIINEITGALGFKQKITVYVLNSQSLNAAATEDGCIIINAGAILQCADARELIAIIAHEVGHIDGRHIITLHAHMAEASAAGLVTMLVGAAVAAVAGNSAPLLAGILGGQTAATKMALSKLRQKEGIADTRAAQAMKKLRWPIFSSFISLHEKLDKGGVYDLYMSTHPAPAERKSKYAMWLVEQAKWTVPQQVYAQLNRYQLTFERIRAKVAALTQTTEHVLAITVKQRDANERYAKAIALYRDCKYQEACAIIDGLLAEAAANGVDPAYYIEIKAMCLIRLKQCRTVAEICWPILKKDGGKRIHRDLGVIYADAVVEAALREHIQNAINVLKKIKLHQRGFIYIFHILGELYTLNGQSDEASLCAAEVSLACGDYKLALLHAKKAQPSRRTATRACDIIAEAERLEKQET
ncbi:MAG: M48 family metalloprotease [Holosporales bacterium]|jgi:predicted Zn-dependent protease|nr:M48 family metalloprotease [Holosporales bacterium]